MIADDELEELFCMIDVDGSSTIDADEFYSVLTAATPEPEMTYEAFKRSMFGTQCGATAALMDELADAFALYDRLWCL
eukprot:SAG31_NODE_3449_length_4257_cov_2.277297_2_plen_78_part_00